MTYAVGDRVRYRGLEAVVVEALPGLRDALIGVRITGPSALTGMVLHLPADLLTPETEEER